MKAIITTYNNTDQGLVLRNNFIKEVPEYSLKEWLGEYDLTLDELNYHVGSVKNSLNKRGYSSIIEIKSTFVYHIRFIN